MRRGSTLLGSILSLTAALIAMLSTVDVAATPGSLSLDARISPRVQQVVQTAQRGSSGSPQIAGDAARFDSKNRLQIDVEFDCAYPAPTASIIAAGMLIGTTVNVPPMCVIEGWAATSSIAALAQIPNVKRVDLPKYSRSHPPLLLHSGFTGPGAAVISATNGAPVIDGNGVSIMRSDKYVQQTGKNGASITIAVISDDATNVAAIQGRGELPASINVVTPEGQQSLKLVKVGDTITAIITDAVLVGVEPAT